MNYAYLAKKYVPGADVVVEDRTYDGLIWRGPGDKPSKEQFAAYQERETQGVRALNHVAAQDSKRMEEMQAQARHQAVLDARPFYDKLKEQSEEIYLKCKAEIEKNLEIHALLRDRETVLICWKEITETQAKINDEAQAYLEDTKQYLAWDPEKIPKQITDLRAKAHARLDFGKTVYADWSSLRSKEMPSRSELLRAISKGGEHLEEMKRLCKEVVLKYPRPKKEHF